MIDNPWEKKKILRQILYQLAKDKKKLAGKLVKK